MIIPKLVLSEYTKQVDKGQIKPNILPFEASIKFNQLGRGDIPSHLEIILKDFKNHFYIEKEEKSLVAHFWEQEQADLA